MNKLQQSTENGLNQEGAEKILNPFLGDIYGCVADGWAAWVKFGEIAAELRYPLKPRSRASFVFDHIVDSAKRRFHDKEGVQCVEKKGLFRLIFANGIIIRFKKFDKNRRSRSIQTRQAQLFSLQYAFDLGEFTLVNLIGGYRLDELGMDIKDILITCPVGSRNQWYLEIPQVAIPEIQSIVQPNIARPRITAKGSVQRTKKTSRAK